MRMGCTFAKVSFFSNLFLILNGIMFHSWYMQMLPEHVCLPVNLFILEHDKIKRPTVDKVETSQISSTQFANLQGKNDFLDPHWIAEKESPSTLKPPNLLNSQQPIRPQKCINYTASLAYEESTGLKTS